MKYVQGAEALPRPIFDAIALTLFGQIGYGKVGSCGEQFDVVFISCREPLRGPVGEDCLQERGSPPLIKIRVFSKVRFKEEVYGRPAHSLEKRNFRQVGV